MNAKRGGRQNASSGRKQLYQLHHRMCQEALTLMVRKNEDYASDSDPYRNFRLFGRYGILIRLSDKIARLRTFEERGKFSVHDETLKDTLLDIINYTVLYQGFR